MKMTIYTANCCGKSNNTVYPNKCVIDNTDDFIAAISNDHVCAEYKNSHRSVADFVSSDCSPFDNDNDHSDNPDEWIRPEDYADMFPDIAYVVVPSRSNMKQKGNKSARPRHHVYFPHPPIADSDEYKSLKEKVIEQYPFFDDNAMDAARFIYGNSVDDVIWHDGSRTIAELFHDSFADWDEEQSGIKEGSRNSTMSHYAGRIIKRLGNTEEAHLQFLRKAEECVPPLEDEELDKIWASAVRFGKKVSAQEGYIPPEDYGKPPEWEKPIPFDEYDLPEFPVDALPGPIADYVSALAESTQTPVDIAAVSAIAILSVCMQGKYKIRAKPDWTEPVNTFVMAVMEPSERKSAVENAMIRPLNLYEAEQNMQNAGAIESSRMQKQILERKQKAIKDQAAKGKADEKDVEKIAEDIANFREMKPLKLYVDDITTEKLTSVLADNDGRAAILSTEGGIFDTLSGAYSRTVNIDVMLKGYSGDTIRVDRIGRNSESVMNPALTVLLMVQPSVLSGLMNNDTFRGRGLTARFLYSMPKSYVGQRNYRSASVPDKTYQEYERLIRNILEDECEDGPDIITLSPEADTMIGNFAEELEPKLKNEYADISDWAGKLVGNVLRISALLCRAFTWRTHGFLAASQPLVVEGNIMADAIRIGEYFIRHSVAAFELMGLDPYMKQGRKVIKTVRENGLTEFTCRDIMRLCRSFKKADDVRKVLNDLIDYGYLAIKPAEEYSGKGRPSAEKYLVNPYVYD